jgi:hypothetical protein
MIWNKDMKTCWIPIILCVAALISFNDNAAAYSYSTPLSFQIYSKEGMPNATHKYPSPQVSYLIFVGDTMALVGKIIDNLGTWLSEYETDTAPITWEYHPQPGSADSMVFTRRSGAKTLFIAPLRYSYSTGYIIGGFLLNSCYLYDTVSVQILLKPDTDYCLVIEPSPDMSISPNQSNPVETMDITSQDSSRSVYAILRDKYGNYVRCSRNTKWMSSDTSTAAVQSNDTSLGEGIITCLKYGSALITASDAMNSARIDSVEVNCLFIDPYVILGIFNQAHQPVDTLVVKVNESVALNVQGHRDDDTHWISVAADWQASPGLELSAVAPAMQPAWEFTATDTGCGWIMVDLESYPHLRPDSIWFCAEPAVSIRQSSYENSFLKLFGKMAIPAGVKDVSVSIYDLTGKCIRRCMKVDVANAAQSIRSLSQSHVTNSEVLLFKVTCRDEAGKSILRTAFVSVLP